MEEREFLSSASWWMPRLRGEPSRWAVHIPLAFWLIEAVKPKTIVQLGARPDDAYFAFCEAVEKLSLESRCFAIDTRNDQLEFMKVCAEVDRRLFQRDNLPHRDFSYLLSTQLDLALESFADRSIDILHIHAMSDFETAFRYFEVWLPKMSDQGLVLLDGVSYGTGRAEPGRLAQNLGGRFPMIEFHHGDHLALVATGTRLPEKIVALLSSSEADPIRARFESCYERLGRGLQEHAARTEVERVRKASDRQSTELNTKVSELKTKASELDAARSSLARVSAELETLHAHARAKDEALEVHNETLEQLRQMNAMVHRDRVVIENRLGEIETSLGWHSILKLRRLRARILRPGTLLDRSYTLASRFVKTSRSVGLHVALRKARERVARKLGRLGRGGSAPGSGLLAHVFRQNAPVDRFRELPWRFLGPDPGTARETVGYYKILLISHSACRTGAPMCLLRLLEELNRLPDVECFVVLQQGGELAESFARLAPTLDLEWLVAQGINRQDAPGVIASAFHEFSSRGVAVCNTLAVHGFHSAFRHHRVDVLSWIHELPTFIALLGGDHAIDEIRQASRRIMVPSEAVRSALTSRFRIDPELIQTVYNGQDPRSHGLDRDALRLEIRRELGLPPDGRIVLGCGTIDLRKGADLFVNVARRVLLEEAKTNGSPRTWFIWVGQGGDATLRRWLVHDTRINSLAERIRFIGPRSSVVPYYMAADLLALTSREDPCPLVNMEAMESGLPVVTFDGAGGAPRGAWRRRSVRSLPRRCCNGNVGWRTCWQIPTSAVRWAVAVGP